MNYYLLLIDSRVLIFWLSFTGYINKHKTQNHIEMDFLAIQHRFYSA